MQSISMIFLFPNIEKNLVRFKFCVIYAFTTNDCHVFTVIACFVFLPKVSINFDTFFGGCGQRVHVFGDLFGVVLPSPRSLLFVKPR